MLHWLESSSERWRWRVKVHQQHQLGELPTLGAEFLPQKTRLPSPRAVVPLVQVLLGGFLAIAPHLPSRAEPIPREVLIAQQRQDGLPSLPPSSTPSKTQPSVPPARNTSPAIPSYPAPTVGPARNTSPAIPSNPAPTVAPAKNTSPAIPSNTQPSAPEPTRYFPPQEQPKSPRPSFKRYVVYIPGDRPSVLARVRLIEPEAFLKEYRGRTVIQAGVFANQYNAQRRARDMELEVGVRSSIATIESSPPPIASASPPLIASASPPPIADSSPLTISASSPPPPPPNLPRNSSSPNLPSGYFVIIPGNRADLPQLANQLIEAGLKPEQIISRESRFGPNLAIGPFPDRRTAQQESGYMKRLGIDGRLDYID